jgi:hypothetical protein
MIIVYGIADKLDPIKERLSAAIHGCMQEVLGLPEDKRAQRFIPLRREDFFYPGGRTDAYTVIEINMIAGRSEDTKKRLILSLFAALNAQVALDPVDVEITIQEQPAHCWGFRGMTGDEARLNYEIKV